MVSEMNATTRAILKVSQIVYTSIQEKAKKPKMSGKFPQLYDGITPLYFS